ncbi:transfer protein [Streptomyces sp. NPDC017941]|uniref:transfer protein n=1 Tax=Streptomyces sp. NPDC017941 TaxID=3365018 RepID=UPI0037BB4551
MRAPDFVEIEVARRPGKLITYDHSALVSALGGKDPACVAVETDGMSRALVTAYRRPPLETLRHARPEDLVMDSEGFITVGRHHDGDPARMRLYEPGSGAQRGALFGTTGAGKSRALQLVLAAEKRSRIVTWLSDLKGGQSVPEARGQVDWRATTEQEAMMQLRAGLCLIMIRTDRYARIGRSYFVVGDPDPLVNIRIDEANRLLQEGSPYRDEAAYLIKEIGRLGRSVGVGISIAAQAGHVEELGGSDTLRGMLKEGDVILLRWSSTMMATLVSDGLLPLGTDLVPIPRRSGPPVLRSRFERTGPRVPGTSTAGQAYLLGSPRPTALMRFFLVGSLVPVPGLDPEIVALYGPGEPARLEAASVPHMGGAYAARGGPVTVNGAGADPGSTAAPAGPEPGATPPAGPTLDPTAPGAGLMPPPSKGKGAPSIRSRILDALAEGPLTKHDLQAKVNADGGRQVRNLAPTLSEMKSHGELEQPQRGLWALPAAAPGD